MPALIETARKTLDLRSKACPETFLYTKLALEKLESGTELRVLLTSGDDAERVRASIGEEGFRTGGNVETEESGGFRITIYTV